MPTSIIGAVVAGVIGGSSIVAGELALGFAFGAFTSSLALGVVSRALAKKPSSGSSNTGGGTVQAQGRLITIRQPVSAWQVIIGEARVGGDLTFFHVSSDNQYTHLIITYAGHRCSAFGDIYLNDEIVPLDVDGNATGKYAGYVRIKKSLGAEGTSQPFADLVAESDGKWTSAHLQAGRTKLYIRLKVNQDLFPAGIPNFTAVIQGALLTDTRTSTSAYSNNAALGVAHYLSNSVYGMSADLTAEFDQTTLNAAANTSDEAVSLDAGGTEPRYRINGAFRTSETPRKIVERMLASFAGCAINVGGKWWIYAGAYDAPTVTLTEADFAGPNVKVQSLVSRREGCNGVKGIFTSPTNSWQPTDFPALASSTYLVEDNNERVWRDVDYSGFVTSGTQAQRLSKIELLRARQGLTVTARFKLSAYRAMTGRTIAVTNTKFGWSAKAFDVVSSKFIVDVDATLGVELVLRETAATLFDWSTSEEQTVDLAPNTNLPDPSAVGAPGVPSITEEIYETSGSAGVKTKALVSWAAPSDVLAVSHQLEWKLHADSAWNVRPPTPGLSDEVIDLEAGLYDFRVKSYNAFDVSGAYASASKELFGLTARPADVSNFAVQSYAGQAKFVWDKSTDLDVRIGGRVYVRWHPTTGAVTWNEGSLVNPEGYPGDTTIGLGPLQTGTYMAKFVDSTGNFSVNAASFVVTEALLTALSSLASVTYNPGFAGTYTNTVVTGGVLQLTATTLWDDMPGNMDDWGYIDYLGGIASSGSCLLSTKLDLGSVLSARLLATLKSEGFSTNDLWDSRLGLMDDWGTVDGDVIEDADVQIMVRQTDNDPNGMSPTWGPWHALGLVGDYRARGFEIRLDFASGDVTHNRRVSEFTMTAKN